MLYFRIGVLLSLLSNFIYCLHYQNKDKIQSDTTRLSENWFTCLENEEKGNYKFLTQWNRVDFNLDNPFRDWRCYLNTSQGYISLILYHISLELVSIKLVSKWIKHLIERPICTKIYRVRMRVVSIKSSHGYWIGSNVQEISCSLTCAQITIRILSLHRMF